LKPAHSNFRSLLIVATPYLWRDTHLSANLVFLTVSVWFRHTRLFNCLWAWTHPHFVSAHVSHCLFQKTHFCGIRFFFLGQKYSISISCTGMFSSLDVECWQALLLWYFCHHCHGNKCCRNSYEHCTHHSGQKLRRGVCWPIGQNRRHAVLHTLFHLVLFARSRLYRWILPRCLAGCSSASWYNLGIYLRNTPPKGNHDVEHVRCEGFTVSGMRSHAQRHGSIFCFASRR